MIPAFDDVKRVLAAVAALALFALNEARMFQMLPTNPGDGRTHALSLQLFGVPTTVYATGFDVAVRWGLVGLILAACAWAVAETLQPPTARRENMDDYR